MVCQLYFKETKLIDYSTKEKIRKDERANPGEKPATLKGVEEVLAFDARWHNLKEDKLMRGRLLNEYISLLEEQGPVDQTKEAGRAKAAKIKIK